jgi:hypothetical protein
MKGEYRNFKKSNHRRGEFRNYYILLKINYIKPFLGGGGI